MSDSLPTHTHDVPAKFTCLGRVPVFNQLGAADTAELSRIIRPAHYKKGETVQLAGDTHSRLLVLNRGRAKLSRTSPGGREQILRMLEPGDFTGELAVFTGEPAGSDIVALEPSSFCTIDGDNLTQLIATHPDLSLRFVGELSRRLDRAERQVESVGLQTAGQKVATALLGYASEDEEFKLPMSKKDLASSLGITAETLSRKLVELEKREVIAMFGQRKIRVINKQILKDLSSY